jgi:hypothetical protein
MLAQYRLMGEPETASMDEEGVLHLTRALAGAERFVDASGHEYAELLAQARLLVKLR